MGCFASQVQSNVTLLAQGSCSVLLEMSFLFSALFPLCFCFIVFSAWMFAFPLEVSVPGQNESTEMHDVQMCIPVLKPFCKSYTAWGEKERRKCSCKKQI